MKKLTAVLMTAAAMGVGPMDVSAQQNATVTIPQVLVLASVDPLIIAGGFDFSGGDIATSTGTVGITTRANILHAVDVSATPISTGVVGAESLVLEIMDPTSTFLTGTVRALADLPRGTQVNTITFQTSANLELHDPGDYTGTITYTVVPNL